MTLATSPKAGRRGDLQSLALAQRSSPFREDHDASATVLPAAPRTWPSCVAWFRDAWEASLPTRLHTRGVEDESALGSPRMAGGMHRRIDHVSDHGWGLTGWDRDGQPRGVDRATGLTIDPFLYNMERMLRGRNDHERMGALALMRWAYLGWDVEAAAQATFVAQHASPETWSLYLAGFRSLLHGTIRTLAIRCQREPERWPVCRGCRQRECICGTKSEAQHNAERGAVDAGG